MARYRKIDTRMWADGKFRELSSPGPSAKYLWVFLLTGPHTTNLPGLFRTGEMSLAEELGWSLEGFRKGFAELLAKGLVRADWKARVVWIPNAIKYNPPDNPNVVKSWRDSWDEVPECPLKDEAYEALKGFTEGLSEGFGKAFREGCAKGLANQEQEQEQEQDKPSRQPAADGGGVAEVIEIWNQTTQGTNLPSARLTEKRTRAIRARLRETGWLQDFKAACGYVQSSNFHRGQNDRDWVANLDYMLQAGKATELAEKAKAVSSARPNGKAGSNNAVENTLALLQGGVQ
jgi:hypothetical protein